METYTHRVSYYETDMMGVVHHSNYIRWMEEARIDFLRQAGWDYARLEAMGIMSPVTAVQCRYRKPAAFPDAISVTVAVGEYRGVRLKLRYAMENEDGDAVCEGTTEHCFVGGDGKPVRLDRACPGFHEFLKGLSSASGK